MSDRKLVSKALAYHRLSDRAPSAATAPIAHIQPGLHVADCGVCRLNAERLHELQQRVAKRQAGLGRFAQFRRWYALALSGRLNIGRMRRAVIAEYDRQTRHALAPNQSYLDLLAVGLNCNNGCRSLLRGNKRRRFACWNARSAFRNPRCTDLRCGPSKLKSSVEYASNLLLLPAIARSSPFRRERSALLKPPTPVGWSLSVDDGPYISSRRLILLASSVRIRTEFRTNQPKKHQRSPIAGAMGIRTGVSYAKGALGCSHLHSRGRTMTIVPFLEGRVFRPEDIQAMSTALEDICTLNLADEAKSERELLAKEIIILAGQGERSAAILRDRMLREVAYGRGGWAAGSNSVGAARAERTGRRGLGRGASRRLRARRPSLNGLPPDSLGRSQREAPGCDGV